MSYCSNQKVLQGYNHLTTKNPSLVKEWNYHQNGELKPTDVTIGSGKKVWWICKHQYEWQSVVTKRNEGQTGCKQCQKEKRDKKRSRKIYNRFVRKLYHSF